MMREIHNTRRRSLVLWIVIVVAAVLPVPSAMAIDPEGCLTCHRYRGLCRFDRDKQTIQLYYVDPKYHDRALGPHARLRCTDCHNRAEVHVVPHTNVSPVDCTRTCHLSAPDRREVRFGHDLIADMLELSAHAEDALKTSNELLGQPLRTDQSRCLLCHDEPVFRRRDDMLLHEEAPISRCDVCHDERLPVNARYFYWHVRARGYPARSNEGTVRVCASCHSNSAVQKHFELPDVTVSYLASFHGKAMLLGSETTAACLDCHVARMQNVHLIKSHESSDSPTHAENVRDTCRSVNCHATAGYRLSTAAVHLDVTTGRGLEYVIACLFIVLIILTFGPSAALTSLELLQVVIGRRDPYHRSRRELADKLLSRPESRQLLTRFTVHQRIQHWLLFVFLTVLVLTGFPIKFADRAWAGWIIDQIGGVGWARMIHRWAGVVLLAGFVYHALYLVVVIWKQKRREKRRLFDTVLDLPMVMRLSDWRHLLELLAYLLFLRRKRPEAGRFSIEEKFEYFGVFWGIVVLGSTGMLMWANVWTSRHLTGRILTIALVVHTFEAFLALLHVGIVHMVSVIFSPRVSPVSMAMFTGVTPPDTLAEGHSAMLTDVARQVGLDENAEGGHA